MVGVNAEDTTCCRQQQHDARNATSVRKSAEKRYGGLLAQVRGKALLRQCRLVPRSGGYPHFHSCARLLGRAALCLTLKLILEMFCWSNVTIDPMAVHTYRAKNTTNKVDLEHRFPLLQWLSYFWMLMKLPTLKLMLHIVGGRAQQ